MNGFVNVLKGAGMSSGDVVARIKRLAGGARVGHMGTLDPAAVGVLPVAIGKATRLFDYLLNKTKRYRAYFTFGISTDTLDSCGQVVARAPACFTEGELRAAAASMCGEQRQVPPQFSAVSVAGRRAYDVARKGGEVLLPAKTIRIDAFEVLGKCGEDTWAVDLMVSAGTYIRSVVRDLAQKLGTVGYMSALIRTQAGPFTIEDALPLEDIQELSAVLLPAEIVLCETEYYEVLEKYAFQLGNGVKLTLPALPDGTFAVRCGGELYGLGQRDETGRLKMTVWLR